MAEITGMHWLDALGREVFDARSALTLADLTQCVANCIAEGDASSEKIARRLVATLGGRILPKLTQ